jgi:hypothetical protein
MFRTPVCTLRRKWSVGRATQDGHTALILAASKGHTECVRLLIEGEANTDAVDFVVRDITYVPDMSIYYFYSRL